MGYTKYNSEQSRVHTQASQLFEALEEVRAESSKSSGSMHWKKIKGSDYLYRGYSYGKNVSLGVRSEETERLKRDFDEQKERHKTLENSLLEKLKVHARYIKANNLNRMPVTAARIMRSFQKSNVPCTVVGTNALYGYESMAGALFLPEHLATDDLDIMLDVRQGMKIISAVQPDGILSLLQKTDKSFGLSRSSGFEFRAINSDGYFVDLITQEDGSPMQMSVFEEMLAADDLQPVVTNSMKWMASAPRKRPVVFDEKGFPLRVSVMDPRAFVIHKYYLSKAPDREPVKQIRDGNQAQVVATMIKNELPQLTYSEGIARLFPQGVRSDSPSFDEFTV